MLLKYRNNFLIFMIMRNLKEALVSMGYRKLESNKSLWMKPFGFSVIAIKIENNIVTMKILFNSKNETEVWSGWEFNIKNDTDILKELKLGECELMRDFYPFSSSPNSKFDFLTKLDQANLISGCI